MKARFTFVAVVALGAAVALASVIGRASADDGVSFTDTFDRTAGAVGNGWTALRGTWAVRSGSVEASGSTTERVLARPTVLGATFSVSTALTLANPSASGRPWAGLATNILDHRDGTQSFYALRVGQRQSDGNTALWQLVRINRSAAAGSTSVLGGGSVTAPPGTTVRLSADSAADGTALTVRVVGATTAQSTVPLRQADRLVGGQPGLYSQDGTMPLHEFALSTTTRPAAVSFADQFNRADGALGGEWTVARGDWRIAGGITVPSGTNERIAYPTAVTLGATFRIGGTLTLPNPAPAARPWAGLAFNLTDNGDGTQTYYVLRIGQQPGDGNNALWQLLRMNRSAASVVRSGGLVAPPGTRLTLTLTSRDLGTAVQFQLTGGARPVDEYVGFPLDDPSTPPLRGGRVGLYSNQGSVGLDDFRVDTTLKPPNVPTRFDNLNCAPTAPADYTVPGGTETADPEVIEVDRTWAGHPVDQQVLTAGNDQYVAYYNADRVMTIAKRTIPSTTWTRQALDSVLGWDSHNYVTMALDATGNLHVAGNMHAVPLIYYRTTTPGDLSTLARVTTMVDPAIENSVTYPRFLTDASGSLLFSYRNGSSGDGSTYYHRYDATTRTWSSLLATPLVNGEGLRNGYEEGPTRGPDGFYHLGIVWRDTPDAGSSSMPSYARSPDLVHWQDSAGNPIATPITYGTADVVDPVPIYGGALNGNLKLGIDAGNNAVLTYSKYDENLTNQLYAARPDGRGGWTITQLTRWTGRWQIKDSGSLGNLPFSLRRGASPLPDGKLRIDYQCGTGQRTLVVDPAAMTVVADVPTPQPPAVITTVQSTFPEMGVRLASSPVSGGRWVLRWETLGANNDAPRDPAKTPDPQPLRLYFLRS